MNEGSSNREMDKLHPELNDMNNKLLLALLCFAGQCSWSRPRYCDELGQEFGWERTILTEFPDVDAGNPPAGAIVEKFEAVHGTAFDRAVRG